MSAQTDFLALYRELGIDPSCSPEAFKRAYRRRVSELHPDRTGEGMAGEEKLKLLNLGYAAALEFLQAHGRFPGAPASAPPPRAPGPATSLPRVQAQHEPQDQPGARHQRRWLSLVLVALAILVVGAQLAGRDGGASAPASDGPHPAPEAHATATAPLEAALDTGLSADEVLHAFGGPTDTAQDGRLWHYGPSWIRLSCSRVVDWYSSPLKPLGLSSMHPDAPADADAREGGCAELDPALGRRY